MNTIVIDIFVTDGCMTSKIMLERLTKATQYKYSGKDLEFGTLFGLCSVKILNLTNSSDREIARSYKVTDAPTIICEKTWYKGNELKGLKSEYVIRNFIRKQLKLINQNKN